MKFNRLTQWLALTLLSSSSSTLAAFDLPAVHVGGFFSDGSADNDAVVFQNYYVGYSTSSSVAERRNFFIFDLSTVTTPVASASLALTLKTGGLIFGVADYGPPPFDMPVFEVEDYILSGTPFSSAEIADISISPAAAMTVFDTFGDPSEAVGGIGFDPLIPVPIPPLGELEVVIDLDPAGISLINDNLGGEVILTGRMLDVSPLFPVDPDGMGPASGEMSEIMWGFTDVLGGPSVTEMPFLSLESVPEPGTSALLAGVIAVGLIGLRRQKR